jgi:septin 7
MPSVQPIIDDVEARFSSYLDQENAASRKAIVDTRIHACLYLIQPTGHSSVNALAWRHLD